MDSEDAILALALCSCGHGIGRHDDDGCPGAHATFCACTLAPAVALDAAIERIRHSNLDRCGGDAERAALPGTMFDAATVGAELNSDDYECVGAVRILDSATVIAMLAPRLVRSQ